MQKKKTEKRSRKSPLEIMAIMATALRPASSRSGAMMGGSFTPTLHGSSFSGRQTIQGRIKHADETRRIKKAQRRRAHLRR